MSDIYDIVLVPDPVLKQRAEEVGGVNDVVKKQMDKMLATMYDAPGIGLAANQVGLLNRIIVMDVAPDGWEYEGEDDGVLLVQSTYRSGKNADEEDSRPKNPIVMANPEIIWESEKQSMFEEGCLSIPQQYAEIIRPAAVKVRYLDYHGKVQEADFEGLPAHCVQHEIDHLNGVLFIDYLSTLKRNMIIKKVAKLTKQHEL